MFDASFRGLRLWEILDFSLLSGSVAQDSLGGGGEGGGLAWDWCLQAFLPVSLSAWWPFVYFAVVAFPLYRMGFIGGFPYFFRGNVY